jgi:hypothetical protein
MGWLLPEDPDGGVCCDNEHIVGRRKLPLCCYTRPADGLVSMLVSAAELGFRAQLRHQQFVRELVVRQYGELAGDSLTCHVSPVS